MTLKEFDLALWGYYNEKGNVEELGALRAARLTAYLNHQYNENLKPQYKEMDLVKFFQLPGETVERLSDKIEDDGDFVESV